MNQKQIVKEIDEIEELFRQANERLHQLSRRINFESETVYCNECAEPISNSLNIIWIPNAQGEDYPICKTCNAEIDKENGVVAK